MPRACRSRTPSRRGSQKRRIYSNEGFDVLGESLRPQPASASPSAGARTIFEPLGWRARIFRAALPMRGRQCVRRRRLSAPNSRPTLVNGPWLRSPHCRSSCACWRRARLWALRPCPWGLGLEIRGEKSPHWTATDASLARSGTLGSPAPSWADCDLRASAALSVREPFGTVASRQLVVAQL